MKDFVPYNEALKLKELGFDERCFLCYSKEGELSNAMTLDKTELNNIGFVLAPTFSQAFRFFRDKYNLTSWVYNSDVDKFFYTILQNGRIIKAHNSVAIYEEAELACLQKLIQIVKDENN